MHRIVLSIWRFDTSQVCIIHGSRKGVQYNYVLSIADSPTLDQDQRLHLLQIKNNMMRDPMSIYSIKFRLAGTRDTIKIPQQTGFYWCKKITVFAESSSGKWDEIVIKPYQLYSDIIFDKDQEAINIHLYASRKIVDYKETGETLQISEFSWFYSFTAAMTTLFKFELHNKQFYDPELYQTQGKRRPMSLSRYLEKLDIFLSACMEHLKRSVDMMLLSFVDQSYKAFIDYKKQIQGHHRDDSGYDSEVESG